MTARQEVEEHSKKDREHIKDLSLESEAASDKSHSLFSAKSSLTETNSASSDTPLPPVAVESSRKMRRPSKVTRTTGHNVEEIRPRVGGEYREESSQATDDSKSILYKISSHAGLKGAETVSVTTPLASKNSGQKLRRRSQVAHSSLHQDVEKNAAHSKVGDEQRKDNVESPILPKTANNSQSSLSTRSNSVATAGNRRGSNATPHRELEKRQSERRPSGATQLETAVHKGVKTTLRRSSKDGQSSLPQQRISVKDLEAEKLPSINWPPSEKQLDTNLFPNGLETPTSSTTRRLNRKVNGFNADINYPQRIGRKVVKKKKREEHKLVSAAHKSNEIRNAVEAVGTTADRNVGGGGAVQSTHPMQSSLTPTFGNIGDVIDTPLASLLKEKQNHSMYGRSNVLKINDSVASPGDKPSATSGGGMGSRLAASNYLKSATSLLQDYMAAATMVPPVRLMPLAPTLDPADIETVGPWKVEGEARGRSVESVADDWNKPARDEEKEEAEEVELVAVVGEGNSSKPKRRVKQFLLPQAPSLEFEEISTTSFTSPFFSYYCLSGPHRREFEAVRRKARGIKKLARRRRYGR